MKYYKKACFLTISFILGAISGFIMLLLLMFALNKSKGACVYTDGELLSEF